MKTYIINAVAMNGTVWALKIDCTTLEEAEYAAECLQLMYHPESGIGELKEEYLDS